MIRGLWARWLPVVLLLGGCHLNSGSTIDAASLEGVELEASTIAFRSPPSTSYGQPTTHALSAIEQAILARLEGVGEHRPALSRFSRELGATTPDANHPPSGLIDALLSWSGLVDPPPDLVLVELKGGDVTCHRELERDCDSPIQTLVEQAMTSAAAHTGALQIGVGVDVYQDKTRMVVALLEPRVELEPFPAAMTPGRPATFAGRLRNDRTNPVLIRVPPGGNASREPIPVAADGTFEFHIACPVTRGVLQLELVAEGRHGPEVAANFPVYCGRRLPRTAVVEVERLRDDVSADVVAQANFNYLNAERQQRGLEPLVWDPKVARVAQAHSLDMMRHHFVGHRSPTTGLAQDRLARASIDAVVARENVARGYGPKGIHESLMRSPGHRANILAEDVTRVGIGVVIGERESSVGARPIYCTQNFYRSSKALVFEHPEVELRRRVDQRRARRRRDPIVWNDDLGQAASRYAQAVMRGRSAPANWDRTLTRLGFRSVVTHQVQSNDFDALVDPSLWGEPTLECGVAVVHDGERFLMVVLVGER